MTQSPSVLRSIILRIGAALVVPVFLIITKSKIIEGITQKNNLSDYLVFVSFCVLASITSSRFLSSVSNSVLQKIEVINGEATLNRIAWGAFIIGVELKNSGT